LGFGTVSGRAITYTKPFMAAITSALISSKPLDNTLALFKHPLYKSAHPTPEHLLPLAVAVAATDPGDELEEIYTADDGLGWGMWRWKVQS
jgi:4,5-DOPA dioxygenase extradiol